VFVAHVVVRNACFVFKPLLITCLVVIRFVRNMLRITLSINYFCLLAVVVLLDQGRKWGRGLRGREAKPPNSIFCVGYVSLM